MLSTSWTSKSKLHFSIIHKPLLHEHTLSPSLLPPIMSIASNFITSLHLQFQNPNPNFPFLTPKSLTIQCARKSKRTGKYRYPSEKKKLKFKPQTQIDVETKFEGFWRLSKLGVSVYKDPGKDFLGISDGLLEEIAKVLKFPVSLPPLYITLFVSWENTWEI